MPYIIDEYWTEEEIKDLEKANDYGHLFPIGYKIIQKMPQPISMVSGPISTGGSGSIEENLKIFAKVIEALKKRGNNIFHQLPFQDVMIRLHRSWKGPGYCMPLLTEFYQPIFETGLIKKIHFMPGWRDSYGSNWEHSECERLGIERLYLSEDFVNKLID